MSVSGKPPYDDQNVFARILRGEVSCKRVHEGAYVFTFRKIDGTWKFTRQVVMANTAFNPMFRRTAR